MANLCLTDGEFLPAIAVCQAPALFQNRRHRGQAHSYKILCLS